VELLYEIPRIGKQTWRRRETSGLYPANLTLIGPVLIKFFPKLNRIQTSQTPSQHDISPSTSYNRSAVAQTENLAICFTSCKQEAEIRLGHTPYAQLCN